LIDRSSGGGAVSPQTHESESEASVKARGSEDELTAGLMAQARQAICDGSGGCFGSYRHGRRYAMGVEVASVRLSARIERGDQIIRVGGAFRHGAV
jgi:hypothetical protein